MTNNSITIGSLTVCCRGPQRGFIVVTPQEEFLLDTQQVFDLLRFINEEHRACLVATAEGPLPGSHWAAQKVQQVLD